VSSLGNLVTFIGEAMKKMFVMDMARCFGLMGQFTRATGLMVSKVGKEYLY
jgi:hypothetical protein